MENYINNFSKKFSNEKYNILCGWKKFSLLFKKQKNKNLIVAIDGDYSTNWKIYKQNLKNILKKKKIVFFDFSECIQSENIINSYFQKKFSDNDKLFGKINKSNFDLILNKTKVNQFKKKFNKFQNSKIKKNFDYIICLGTGIGSLSFKKKFDLFLYSNLTRSNALKNNQKKLNKGKTQTISPNLFYYIIFPIMEKYQEKIIPLADYYIDFRNNSVPVLISYKSFKEIIELLSSNTIIFKPIYEAGVWGGQWLVKKRKLNLPNCAIGIELIAQEQSIIANFKGIKVEFPFTLLMTFKGNNILGKKYSIKYNNYFPVRIAYDDTFKNKGENLSIQVHPNKSYMQKKFKEPLGQAEMYYIADTLPKSKVYLGFKKTINKKIFVKEIIQSSKNNNKIVYQKYINSEDSKKGNLFLIPPGTVHASGANNLVLEISNTPYRYTFKIYDYCRKNLDGKKRSLSIEHALNVLKFSRKKNWVKKYLCPKPKLIKNNSNCKEFLLSNNKNYTFNLYRIHFNNFYFDTTKKSMHILNLVEGTRIKIISLKNNCEKIISLSETLLIPQSLGEYKILNIDKYECRVIKVVLK